MNKIPKQPLHTRELRPVACEGHDDRARQRFTILSIP